MNSFNPYSYELPQDKIAQRPIVPPESAKMMVVSRASSEVEHRTFAGFSDYMRPGDLLVFNDTKVIPARLFGRLETMEGEQVEIVLIEEQHVGVWTALGFPMRKIRQAEQIVFSERLVADVLNSPQQEILLLQFKGDVSDKLVELIYEHGVMPIPPYIRDGRADERDQRDYQSIFARHPGSIAAPTASLHFTETAINRLKGESGCEIAHVTLHVGTASFQPIMVNGSLRMPGKERLNVSDECLEKCKAAKVRGNRVIAIGTTVVRALESAVRHQDADNKQASTELFIEPGFDFQVVDALVTNFHQPRTTHLLLVEAFMGAHLLDYSYKSALQEAYRFLSYGDGMLIL